MIHPLQENFRIPNALLDVINAHNLLAKEKRKVIADRSQQKVRPNNLWTWMDSIISLLFPHTQQINLRSGLRGSRAPSTFELYSRHLLKLLNIEPNLLKWNNRLLVDVCSAQHQRSRFSRPQASVIQILSAVDFLLRKLLPSPFLPPTSLLDIKVVKTIAIPSAARFSAEANAPTIKQPRFDVKLVLDGLERSLTRSSPIPITTLRRAAIALYDIYLPSRASEIAFKLTFRNAVFAKSLKSPIGRRPLAEVVLDGAVDFSSLANSPFIIIFQLCGTKGDRKGKGVVKIVPHVPGVLLSPALILLVYLRRRVLKDSVTSIPPTAYIFAPLHDPSFKKSISDRQVAKLLGNLTQKFCGVRTKARGWRSEAATYLHDNGLSMEQIAVRGGWFQTDTILNNYLQNQETDPKIVERLFDSAAPRR